MKTERLSVVESFETSLGFDLVVIGVKRFKSMRVLSFELVKPFPRFVESLESLE